MLNVDIATFEINCHLESKIDFFLYDRARRFLCQQLVALLQPGGAVGAGAGAASMSVGSSGAGSAGRAATLRTPLARTSITFNTSHVASEYSFIYKS